MKKKVNKKHSIQKQKPQSFTYTRYIVISIITLVVVFAGKGLFDATKQVHVLGVQTGPILLADHGSDDSGGGGSSGGSGSSSSGGGSNSGGGGSSNSGGSSSSNSGGGSSSGSSGGGSNSSGSSGGSSSGGNGSSSVSDTTQVDCVGPDGTHFTTSFKSCSDFNNGWHHSNFSFTPLSNPQAQPQKQPEQEIKQEAPETEIKQPNTTQQKITKLEVKTEDGKSEVELEKDGTEVRIESEGNKFVIKTKNSDGTEVELKQDDALEKLNETLKEKDVELNKNEDNNLTITKGEVEAETELPINVDPTTHELTVTTSAGTKTVSILPDKAVENLLNAKVLSSVESQVSQQNEKTTQKAVLTQVNNEPVFEVKGVSQKKILGIFPVAFAKTGFVSVETGQIIKTDETLLNRIFEALSF